MTELNSSKSSRRKISSNPWTIRRFGSRIQRVREMQLYFRASKRRSFLSFSFLFVSSFSFLEWRNGKRRDLRAAAHRDDFRGNRGNVKFREVFARSGRSRRPRNDPADNRDKR